jgi:hypothetical protein
MTIVGIIVSMVYYVLSGFTQQFYGYQNQQEAVTNGLLFQEVFERDLYNSTAIYYEEGILTMTGAASNKTYQFKDSGVLRHAVSVDTFKLAVAAVRVEEQDNEKEFYKTISLDTEIDKQFVTLFFTKRISIAKKINDSFIDEY